MIAKVAIFIEINVRCIEKLHFEGVESDVFKGFEGEIVQDRGFEHHNYFQDFKKFYHISGSILKSSPDVSHKVSCGIYFIVYLTPVSFQGKHSL